MEDHGQGNNILVLGGDSTNSMSGCKGLPLLKRKVFWVICQIYTNELPRCHLIEYVDEKTTSNGGFSGPIGKKLSNVISMVKKSQISSYSSSSTIDRNSR